MSNIIKVVFMAVVTVALTITLISISSIDDNQEKTSLTNSPLVKPFPKRVSRFLAENNNPRASDHCKKDDEICYILEGKNSTCCNNKCMDLSEDKHNCGACKNKCKFTSSCCRGECVNLAYDKRNCGSCGNKCMPGGYCIYGLCNYA
ncbi:stigma-specific STIG1-like protein 1 [Rutidosis leptorrhynchoides]|uniref:stigma-specific STIG1-like protein 1 n=1 Tax=Rutidosis leptorrhynchoides TaxID=125765 RepID=UPI003A9A1691